MNYVSIIKELGKSWNLEKRSVAEFRRICLNDVWRPPQKR